LLWATYYGGSDSDKGEGICTDNLGNVYITGETGGADFPTYASVGAYNQMIYGGGMRDAFIVKFDSTGVQKWSTFYGGTEYDVGNDICHDNSNNIYLTGLTHGPDFPIQNLSGAFNQTTHAGSSDGFILKFDNSNARLWASYYGGGYKDNCTAISTDNSGYLNICGITESSDFPVQSLSGAYNQLVKGNNKDAFILRFNTNSERLWATFYGEDGLDEANDIYNDMPGNTYVCGSTWSDAFPTLELTGAYNKDTLDGDSDAFILKFSPTPVSINETSNNLNELQLFQNFPNPADNTTNINFSLKEDSYIELIICDICGKEVLKPFEGMLFKGKYEVIIDVKQLEDGLYFYTLITEYNYCTKKIIILK